MSIGAHEAQEDLIRCRFPSGPVHDSDLMLLQKVLALHHAIEALHFERYIDEPGSHPRIQRDAMMACVDLQVADLSHPIPDIDVEDFGPELQVARHIRGPQTDPL